MHSEGQNQPAQFSLCAYREASHSSTLKKKGKCSDQNVYTDMQTDLRFCISVVYALRSGIGKQSILFVGFLGVF